MTTPREPDSILAAWLEEGPNQLPEATRRAIAVNIRTTHQTRHLNWVPWRNISMNPLARLAVIAIAIVAAIGGTVYILAPGGQVGGQPSTVAPSSPTSSRSLAPTPSLAATPIDTAGWTTYVSDRYGFSARYPSSFRAVPSYTFWRIPNFTGNMFDGFNSAGIVKWLYGASMALPAGMTQEAWLDAYRRDLVEDGSPLEPEACFEPREAWTPVTIDGRAAELRVGCQTLEAVLFVDDRVYLFGASFYDGAVPSTAEPGVPDDFRHLLETWLTTITLDPASAVAPPSASPIPSPT